MRKRILPFLRNTLHPHSQLGDITFSSVDDSIIGNFQSTIESTEISNEEDGIGSIFLSQQGDISENTIADSRVGEILSMCSGGDVCCALVRLEKVLPKEPSEKLPAFESTLSTKAHTNDVDAVLEGAEHVSPATHSLVPIRPPFWVEKDPITHQRIDTH